MVKKKHTVKWLIIGDKYKRILFISTMYNGKTHDFTIFKAIFSGMDFSALKLQVDLGFLGIKKKVTFSEIFIPHKASKNPPLTQEQKCENRILAALRVVVENAIAKIKAFFILRIENRMKRKDKLADAFDICTLIANFKNKLLIHN